MSTVFDQRLLWVYQDGDSVQETDIAALAGNISSATPNVAGLLLKTSHGAEWQGLRDSRSRLAIKGPGSIRRWVQTLGKSGLETHLWCVLRGADVRAETRLVTQACNVPGVRSMLLSFEAEPGAGYFSGGSAATARELITRIRAGIAPDFHLGLNLDARGKHPASIRLRQWLPFVQSLHPMIFHYEFSGGRRGPEFWLDQAFGTLARYGLPLVPMLQSYPRPGPVPAAQVQRAAAGAWRKGASGLSIFRYGGRLLHRADSGRRAQHQPAGRRSRGRLAGRARTARLSRERDAPARASFAAAQLPDAGVRDARHGCGGQRQLAHGGGELRLVAQRAGLAAAGTQRPSPYADDRDHSRHAAPWPGADDHARTAPARPRSPADSAEALPRHGQGAGRAQPAAAAARIPA